MAINNGMELIKNLVGKKPAKKPPAYPWQEFALLIIDQLNIPPQKRNSVFKVCKQKPKNFIEKCLNDTKELCKTGESWKYFFKLVEKK